MDDQPDRAWYAARAVEHRWSRATLIHHLATGLRQGTGTAANNVAVVAAGEPDLALEVLQDP